MPHVTFIHGIANKPPAEVLKKIWLDALSRDLLGNGDSIDLGVNGITSSMIYWADVLYGEPTAADTFEHVADLESTPAIAGAQAEDPDMSWRGQISGEEREIVDALAAKLSFDVLLNDAFTPPADMIGRTLERIPLPWFIKRRMMKWLLKDAHHYLFNYEYKPRPGANYKVQDEIRSRILKALNEVQTDRHIVVSHSMGTIMMYDCLKRVAECPAIDGLITIGSPLGIDEVQDMLKPEWTRHDGYPAKLNGPWVNVYDPLDPVVLFDGNIANDFRKGGEEAIEVISESNWGSWRHNIANYLSEPKMRAALVKMLDI